jgi:hypothetical protein
MKKEKTISYKELEKILEKTLDQLIKEKEKKQK